MWTNYNTICSKCKPMNYCKYGCNRYYILLKLEIMKWTLTWILFLMKWSWQGPWTVKSTVMIPWFLGVSTAVLTVVLCTNSKPWNLFSNHETKAMRHIRTTWRYKMVNSIWRNVSVSQIYDMIILLFKLFIDNLEEPSACKHIGYELN